jgi:beta-fructofuranosidase
MSEPLTSEGDIFYRPHDAFVGDVIPFHWDGKFHMFYLKAHRPATHYMAEGAYAWEHRVSSDLIHWDDWPVAIEPGGVGDADYLGCWTGSVIEREGTFHLFYSTALVAEGRTQAVLHATSRDLRTWIKDERNPIFQADRRWYEPIDWRDPFVFWNDATSEYWMLLAACSKTEPLRHRGCIGLAVSPDLENWQVRPPLWAPQMYRAALECPDLFRCGDRWVLLFSESGDTSLTHYRVSESLNGPWLAPSNDTLDGRAFYAAKTTSDGDRRYAFGWIPTREADDDTGDWEWAGNLAIHELTVTDDQGIAMRLPPQVGDLFRSSQAIALSPLLGEWQATNGSIAGEAHDFAVATLGRVPDQCRIDVTVSCTLDTRSCGILFRAGENLNTYYEIRWEPASKRIVYDRWPKPNHEQWPRPAASSFRMERPVNSYPPADLKLTILIEGSVVVAYIDETVALSCRSYDKRADEFGLFVTEGAAMFSDLALRCRA